MEQAIWMVAALVAFLAGTLLGALIHSHLWQRRLDRSLLVLVSEDQRSDLRVAASVLGSMAPSDYTARIVKTLKRLAGDRP